jgi:hypothetical protein
MKFMFHLGYSSGFHKAVQKLNIALIGSSHILWVNLIIKIFLIKISHLAYFTT